MSTTRSTLGNGETLKPGNSLWSPDGSVEFKVQVDGKIAVYWGGQCRWQSSVNQRNDLTGLVMQEDGNLVLYVTGGVAIWQANTADKTAGKTHMLAVQNDGNVVVYQGTSLFTTKTTKT